MGGESDEVSRRGRVLREREVGAGWIGDGGGRVGGLGVQRLGVLGVGEDGRVVVDVGDSEADPGRVHPAAVTPTFLTL